jgi:hypothetical protein
MRARSNDVRRLWGWRGLSPAERFAACEPVAPERRAAFLAAVQALRADERARRDPLCDGRHRAAIERASVRRAFVDTGNLEINPRRVSTAIQPINCAGN